MKQHYYHNIREQIRTLAEQQVQLKKERKSTYSGKRLHTHNRWLKQEWYAAQCHRDNRKMLMHLHMAYERMRGKDITPPKNKMFQWSLINKLVEQYKPVQQDQSVAA